MLYILVPTISVLPISTIFGAQIYLPPKQNNWECFVLGGTSFPNGWVMPHLWLFCFVRL